MSKIIKRYLLIFGCFAFLLFLKSVYFQMVFANIISFSTIWKAPFDFIIFYMPKLLPSIVVASSIFLTRRHWWTVVVAVLIDLWCIANILYYRAYGLFLTLNELTIVDNLNGFGDSIITFLKPSFILFPLTTVIYGLVLYYIKRYKCKQVNHDPNIRREVKKRLLYCGSILVCVELLSSYRYFYDRAKNDTEAPYWVGDTKSPTLLETLNPLYGVKNYIQVGEKKPFYTYMVIYHYSAISYIPMIIGDYIVSEKLQPIPSLSDQEMRPFVEDYFEKNISSNKMFVILVESLESWTLNAIGDSGTVVTPNIKKIINSEHTLYAPYMQSQTKVGNSGDGQMIALTGLLPISRGAACMRYGSNTYPSLVKLFKRSLIINPCPMVWNQKSMNECYGFSKSCDPKNEAWRDYDVFEQLCRHCDSNDFILAITISSHLPFAEGDCGSVYFSDGLPKTLNRYLNTIHYMDSCLGLFINKIQYDSTLRKSTIVITGDHTVFKKEMLSDFHSQYHGNNVSIPQEENFIPLIIYSPLIHGKKHINDTIYQMDIYPTLRYLSGCDSYWKGLGVNIMDDSLRLNRKITESDAYILSDKIIRSDFFKSVKNNID